MKFRNPKSKRICLMDVRNNISNAEIQALCCSYGYIRDFARKGEYTFVEYNDANTAEQALMNILEYNKWKLRGDFALPRERRSLLENISMNANKGVCDNGKSHQSSQIDIIPAEMISTNCVFCFQPADKICNRCADYYCSNICQWKDWSRHRLICFPMPHLIKAENLHMIIPDPTKNAISKDLPSHVDVVKMNNSGVVDVKTHNDNAVSICQTDRNAGNAANSTFKDTPTSTNNNVPCLISSISNRNDDTRIPNEAIKSSMNDIDYQQCKPISEKFVQAKPDTVAQVKDEVDAGSTMQNNAQTLSPSVLVKSKFKLPPSEPIRPGDKVILSHVVDHTFVFVRPVQTTDTLIDIMTKTACYADNAKPLTELPDHLELVLAPYESQYYRAVVLKPIAKTEPIKVAFIDFGNDDLVDFSQLKELNPELAARNKLITKIQLKFGVDLNTEKILACLDEFCNDGTELIIDFDESVPIKDAICNLKIVGVKPFSSKEQTLNAKEETTVSSEGQEVPQQDIQRVIIEGENLRLIVVEPSLVKKGTVTVIKYEDSQTFQENEWKCASYASDIASKTDSYKPSIGEICLAKNQDDDWGRAQCLGVEDNRKFNMFYIDWGTYFSCALNDIRTLPENLYYPRLSNICLLEGLNLDNPELEQIPQIHVKSAVYDKQLDAIKCTFTDEMKEYF